MTEQQKQIAAHFRSIIELLGENPDREGLSDTPSRVSRMYGELLSGYEKNAADYMKTFEQRENGGLVKITQIPFTSLCEHHLLPFIGTVEIVYEPDGRVLGLSKFGRIVEVFARRLQLQEKMTHQIAQSIFQHLKPRAVKVIVTAEHLCMSIRGVQKRGAITVTEFQMGEFSRR
jgi:GTP cyclohydrolase I